MPFLPNAKPSSTKSHSRSASQTQPPPPSSSSPPLIKMSSSEKPSRSSKNALKRLTHEIKDLQNSPPDSVLHLGPSNDEDLFQWEAVLRGPQDPSSPYHGGLWLLSITVPPNYPLAPPKVSFVTPICHPNVHFTSGEICLTLLSGEHWTAAYNLSTTVSAIQQLLSTPGLDSPLNVDIANLYREGDSIGAEGLVRFWTAEKRWAGEGKAGWISERRPGTGGKLGERAGF